MTRIDWLVFRRVGARVSLTVIVFLAFFALVESLNTTKLHMLSSIGGPPLALAGIALSALRASIGALPVTILIGTMAGVLDLQSRRELTVIQSSGYSIWRIVRVPLLVTLALTLVVSLAGETLLILGNRALPGEPISNEAGSTWLEQSGADGNYILFAQRLTAKPPEIYGVKIYFSASAVRDRIEAESARLERGHWHFDIAVRYSPDAAPRTLTDFSLATNTTAGDLSLHASGARDLTLPELLRAATSSLSEASLRAVTRTSLFRNIMLPFMVAGSMLIGFAAAARYRRTIDYGNTVLFGIVIGFILYTLNEMAVRAGNADVLPPIVATAGPAFVSILVGTTALLYSQDGNL